MNILEYMKDHIVYLDGGMGTLLQNAGLAPGEYPELWNITRPEVIREIHAAYFAAGSNVVCTNTFGANTLKFSPSELDKIIGCAVENARIAASGAPCGTERFVALDIGPTGRLLKPYGDFEFESAVEVFAEIVKAGVRHGVDLIYIETMNDSYETKAALLAAKENCSLPVFVTNAYEKDGKLMTGASPEAMAAMLEGMGADAIGVNCSFGPRELSAVVERLLKVSSVPVIFKPNAGLPTTLNGKTVYDVAPEDFAKSVKELIGQGVRLAGGCCGTTPEYISALVQKTRDMAPVPVTEKNITCISSYTHALSFEDGPILIGERINPTGKKRLKQALKEGDTDYVLSEGLRQQECGVHALDVNAGLPEIDEKEVLPLLVRELQAVCDLPLQIDSSDAEAMERALRLYNGKAMINSVNGKKESMEAVFPLVKKYGGVVAALTLDENGIPSDARGRVEIAKKIIKTAAEYGISKKNIVFDTLAMAVSADSTAPLTALRALGTIKNELGCHTMLGVSNISFGLPSRDIINGCFFTSALENGLSAAIMNPYSADMMKSYYAFRALHGLDENCAEYIEFAGKYAVGSAALQATAPTSATTSERSVADSDGKGKSPLFYAVIKGLKESAAQHAKELIVTSAPLDVVQNEIIPALDEVGRGFENKTVYLPQLLMSAESAKSAFEVIKSSMSRGKENIEPRCGFVIATVHGDIHDIGKNIVKLLLENYGFDVTDLGKDVPPEKIVEATVKTHAPLVGLSALMTTTVPAMEETIKQLREKAPWCKIVVGGAVLNKEYAESIGADKYAKDAMETVRYAMGISSPNP